ncbi:MAG: LacI family DNA-binding transcriptional regulator [Anaerolineae bacterium]|nr:LacI family DNA-binding transcriptional regulator [Anaerolineae bacterium]
MNNQGEISHETRARVQAAIAELGYHPNVLASSSLRRHLDPWAGLRGSPVRHAAAERHPGL